MVRGSSPPPVGVFCFSELFFVKEPRDVTVLRKDAVILDCQAQGEVPVHIRWLKNGSPLAETDRVYPLANGSLFISEAENRRGEKSDEGSYQCLAQNKYGAILSQKARLTIAKEQVQQAWLFRDISLSPLRFHYTHPQDLPCSSALAGCDSDLWG
ncbi:hypothetical protein AOLI_G00101800 [Acnodon oligacanthus]